MRSNIDGMTACHAVSSGVSLTLLLVLALVLAGCGGGHRTPSRAEKIRCAHALFRVNVQVWVLNQPGDYTTAAAACPWVSQAVIVKATRRGDHQYLRNLAKDLG